MVSSWIAPLQVHVCICVHFITDPTVNRIMREHDDIMSPGAKIELVSTGDARRGEDRIIIKLCSLVFMVGYSGRIKC